MKFTVWAIIAFQSRDAFIVNGFFRALRRRHKRAVSGLAVWRYEEYEVIKVVVLLF
jgi:hypothetical protein